MVLVKLLMLTSWKKFTFFSKHFLHSNIQHQYNIKYVFTKHHVLTIEMNPYFSSITNLPLQCLKLWNLLSLADKKLKKLEILVNFFSANN